MQALLSGIKLAQKLKKKHSTEWRSETSDETLRIVVRLPTAS